MTRSKRIVFKIIQPLDGDLPLYCNGLIGVRFPGATRILRLEHPIPAEGGSVPSSIVVTLQRSRTGIDMLQNTTLVLSSEARVRLPQSRSTERRAESQETQSRSWAMASASPASM